MKFTLVYHKIFLLISQYWFRYWCSATRKQAITCTSVDQVLWCNMVWIGLNKLNIVWYWTYKMPVRYILSSVWVRLSIFSPFSLIRYVGLCVFFLPISLVMIERISILCLIIIIKSEVWTFTLCLGLGHETMVPAVYLSTFLCSNIFHLVCFMSSYHLLQVDSVMRRLYQYWCIF